MVSAIPIATIIVYATLILPLLYCIFKHGKAGLLGWLVLQSFCTVRIVGSVLQIHSDSTGNDVTATLVVSNFGLSPLLLGVLGIIHEARTARDPTMNTKMEWRRVLAFHGLVVFGMVLFITGIVNEVNDQTTKPNTLMKVGAIVLLLCVAVLGAWVFWSFQQRSRTTLPAWTDGTILLGSVGCVLPCILLRTLYSVIATFETDPGFKNSLAAKWCLAVVPEMILVAVLTVNGVRTGNIVSKKRTGIAEHAATEGLQKYPTAYVTE